jgi:hypothetical protein
MHSILQFSKGGQDLLFAEKQRKKILFFSKKSKNTALAGQGETAPLAPLRTPILVDYLFQDLKDLLNYQGV